jgi:selenophosphate synthase
VTFTSVAPRVPQELLLLACDAQTSGGLVVTLAATGATEFTEMLPSAVPIGEVLPATAGRSELELV